jgi:NhaP-type Na+/H+ or K+/H+ antiporter
MEHHLTAILALVVASGVIAQWIAWRLRLPAIVLFMVVGLTLGPLLHLINPSEDFGSLYRPVINLAVAVILFEGGLNLKFSELRQASQGVRRLILFAGPLVWIMASGAAHTIGGLSWPVALVFGAIVVVTGPTVIIPLLRQAGLNRRTASYLKWEAIINDPIGALLAVLVFQYFVFSAQGATAADVFQQMGLGILAAIAIGAGGARLLAWSFPRAFVPEYLKAPLTMAAVLGAYVLSNEVQPEAGLLAVTVFGMVLGNHNIPSLEEIRRFKDNITVLLVSSVFVLLTADIDPDVLLHLDWRSAALILVIMFVVRPLAVIGSTIFSDVPWKDRVLVGWIGPRGIVAAAVGGIFGPHLVAAGHEDAVLLYPLIFTLVLSTVIAHGFSIGRLAKWMGLTAAPNGLMVVGASPWTTELARVLSRDLKVNVVLVDSSWHRLREARLDGLRIVHGEILSEHVQQSLDFGEINCMLAASSNDAYNALVCSHFTSFLERTRVYQLPMYISDDNGAGKAGAKAGGKTQERRAQPHRGNPVFAPDAQFEELWLRHDQGWKFHKTRLTAEYGTEQLKRDLLDGTMMIGILREDGRLDLNVIGESLKARSGDTVIYYSPSRPPAASRAVTGPTDA